MVYPYSVKPTHMAMGFATTQATVFYRDSFSEQPWRSRSSLLFSSVGAFPQAKITRLEAPFFQPNMNRKTPFSAFSASERDLELADEELLQESTPLEAFFNRHSSFFESLEAGRIRHVIESGAIHTENPSPSILVMLGSEAFVNQLFDVYPEGCIEVSHFSLNVLASIKENHDDARCFYINTTDFSEISGSFDAIFLNYFPIFSKSFPKLLKDAARLCKPGGMVVVSLAEGRKGLVSLKDQSGGLLKSHLPDKDELNNMVSALPLELVSFEDLPNFYLATLQSKGAYNRGKKTGSKHISLTKEESEYPLYISGEVIHGFGRGSKQLGYPTANLSVENLPSKAAKLPKGVYFGCAQIIGSGVDSNVHRMVMNIGNRPTFDKDDTISLEVHILHDYGIDFHGKELRIAILGFIREEMQFSSLDELIKRIEKDIEVMQTRLTDSEFEFHRGVSFFS